MTTPTPDPRPHDLWPHRPRVYLAGKIEPHDWRHDVVAGLRGAWCNDLPDPMEPETWTGWPILPGAVFDAPLRPGGARGVGPADYVGPYFIACDHACAHGTSTHATAGGCVQPSVDAARAFVHRQCLRALHYADLVFAWLDNPSAYGTLVELGYATALRKRIVIAHPGDLRIVRDMWFAMASCAPGDIITTVSPVETLRDLLSSPIGWQAPAELAVAEAEAGVWSRR